MSFLRSHLFIALVSLFVLTGYGFDLFGDCCPRCKDGQTERATSAPQDQTPTDGHQCQCICHQITTAFIPTLVQLAPRVFEARDFVAHPDEFPPDAVPLGIEYPPQLA